MSASTGRGRVATVVSLRAFSGRERPGGETVDTDAGESRSARVSTLLGELTQIWKKVCETQRFVEPGAGDGIVGSGASDPGTEQLCRRMMHALGPKWSTKIVSCERDSRIFCVLFVWREDLVARPSPTDMDSLWIIEPHSPRIRSVDVESDYRNWTIRPGRFVDYLHGRRRLPN